MFIDTRNERKERKKKETRPSFDTRAENRKQLYFSNFVCTCIERYFFVSMYTIHIALFDPPNVSRPHELFVPSRACVQVKYVSRRYVFTPSIGSRNRDFVVPMFFVY